MHDSERRKIILSDEDFERIVTASAKRAKESALRDIYVEVGKSFLKLLVWALSAAGAAIAAFFHIKGS